MFNKINYFAFLTLVLALGVSCAKNKHQAFEGRLIESCDNSAPVANTEVEIYHLEKSDGLGNGGRSFSYTTTTGANGNFSFGFREKNWDAAAHGTYGAEIIVDGRVILHGVTSGHGDLGDIPVDYRRHVRVYSTISTDNLSSEDTVFINGEFFRTGGFSAVNDTIEARLVNRVPDDRRVPVIDEVREAEIRWQIKTGSGERTNGTEAFAVAGDCIEVTQHTFTISP